MSERKLALVVQFSAMDRLSGALRNIMGLGRNGSRALRDLKGEAARLKREIADAGRAISGASGNVTGLVNRQRALERQLLATNLQIERQKRALAEAARIDAVNSRADAIRARGEAMQTSGQENMVAGTVMGAPLLLAVRNAGEFSSLLEDIRQRVGPAAAGMADLSDNILVMARETRQLPADMGRVFDVLTGKGLDLRRAMDMAPTIGRFATAYRVDVADASDAAYAAVQNLRVGTDQTNRVLGVFAATGAEGAFEVRDMARHLNGLTARMQVMQETGVPAAASLGAALQVAMRTAGNSDEAANNIANLMDTLNSPETIQRFARHAGVDLPAALRRLRAQGMSTFEAIATITQEATGGDSVKIGRLFGDRQARMGLIALTSNIEEFRRVRNAALAGGNSAIARAFDSRVMNDANTNWRAFQTSLSALAIIAGQRLLPTVTRVIDRITGVVDAIGRWAQTNPVAATTILQIIAGLAAARVAFGALQFAIGGLFSPIASLYSWMAKSALAGSLFTRAYGLVGNAVVRAIVYFGRFGGILGWLRTGAMALGAAVAAIGWPITLTIAAIIAVAAAIYTWWTPISNFVSGVWNSIAGYIRANWTRIRNILLGALVIFMPVVAAALWVGAKIRQHWGAISGFFRSIFATISGFVSAFVAVQMQRWHAWQTGMMAVVNWVSRIVAPFLAPFQAIITFLGGLANQMIGFGSAIVQGLINGIRSRLGSLFSLITDSLGSIGARFARELGIQSPSRVFMAYGRNISQGLAIGIDRSSGGPQDSMDQLARATARAFNPGRFGTGPTPANDRRAAANGNGATAGGHGWVINITQLPGENAEALAERVMRKVEQREAKRGRASYADR